jgi:hypothetical protein
VEKRVCEIEGEAQSHDPAEDKIEHEAPQAFAAQRA